MILGLFGSRRPQAPFDFYKMAVHYGVCHGPVTAIRRIVARDKIIWEGYQENNLTTSIIQDEVFGGFRKEGGVAGVVDFLLGGPPQVLSNALADLIGLTPATAPAYRGVTSLWFRWDDTIPPGIYDGQRNGFYWGTVATLPDIAVQVTKLHDSLGPAFSSIGPNPDMNPSHIIYECLVNDDWGRGLPASLIDKPAFEQAAEYLFNEQFGLSLIWAQQQNVDAFIQEILDHISATLSLNPKTGLITLKLIRDDYDVDMLPVFGPDELIVTSFQRESIAETINELVVTWTNPENEQEETVSLQDLANITIQGAIVSDSANYFGIRNADLAMKICARDLRQRGYPLAQLSLQVNRSAWDLIPGDVIKLNYPEYGIEALVLRVFNVDYGSVGNPVVSVEATEDIFGLEASEFTTPPPSQWVDPTQDPTPMTATLITTLPYYLLSRQISQSDLNSLSSGEGVAGIFAASSNPDVSFYELLAERLDDLNNLTFVSLGERVQIGRCSLGAALPLEAQSTIPLGSVIGATRPRVGNYLLLGESEDEQEVAQIVAVSGSDFTLDRGLLDTVPQNWSLGSTAFVFDLETLLSDEGADVEGATVRFRLRTRTSRGTLPEVDAPIESHILSNRAFLPLCPSNCTVNGVDFGTVTALVTDDLSLEWSIRSYLETPASPPRWTDASQPNPTGQLTVIEIFDETDTLVFSTTSSSDSLTVASGSLPVDVGAYTVVFAATSVNGDSLQSFSLAVNRN